MVEEVQTNEYLGDGFHKLTVMVRRASSEEAMVSVVVVVVVVGGVTVQIYKYLPGFCKSGFGAFHEE